MDEIQFKNQEEILKRQHNFFVNCFVVLESRISISLWQAETAELNFTQSASLTKIVRGTVFEYL